MPYNTEIADIIRGKVMNGETDFSLPDYDQTIVTNTARYLAKELGVPDIYTDYSNTAVISFPRVKR